MLMVICEACAASPFRSVPPPLTVKLTLLSKAGPGVTVLLPMLAGRNVGDMLEAAYYLGVRAGGLCPEVRFDLCWADAAIPPNAVVFAIRNCYVTPPHLEITGSTATIVGRCEISEMFGNRYELYSAFLPSGLGPILHVLSVKAQFGPHGDQIPQELGDGLALPVDVRDPQPQPVPTSTISAGWGAVHKYLGDRPNWADWHLSLLIPWRWARGTDSCHTSADLSGDVVSGLLVRLYEQRPGQGGKAFEYRFSDNKLVPCRETT